MLTPQGRGDDDDDDDGVESMGQRQMGQSASQSMIDRLLLSVIDSHAKDREIIVVGRRFGAGGRWLGWELLGGRRSAVGGAAGIIVRLFIIFGRGVDFDFVELRD